MATRQDYHDIQAAFQRSRGRADADSSIGAAIGNRTLDHLAAEIATRMLAKNPRFDPKRFLKGCGLTDDPEAVFSMGGENIPMREARQEERIAALRKGGSDPQASEPVASEVE